MLSAISKRDPENSPEYSEFLYLREPLQDAHRLEQHWNLAGAPGKGQWNRGHCALADQQAYHFERVVRLEQQQIPGCHGRRLHQC